MANIKSSKKDKIRSISRKFRNNSKKSRIKTFFKKVKENAKIKNLKKCLYYFKIFQSIVDKYSVKKIIHKNKAARHKHNLVKIIKKISNIKN
ncbi:30S ribosomal protein S20 [Buchnera aphidicola (Ceratovacuna keduensis)]|uniref:30S ribosomal protein S20 n=1 Tax=Buchnera aphidicola TaxID=9 RepID=UPI0031B8916E